MTDVNITERALWAVINGMGWWFWFGVAMLGAWNLWGVFRLAASETTLGKVIRALAVMGFTLSTLSLFNTAFGPLSIPFVYLSYRGITWQQRLACLKAGKIPDTRGQTIGVKLAAMVVEPPSAPPQPR